MPYHLLRCDNGLSCGDSDAGNLLVEGDNLPVGILLCTQKDNTLVEYALAGMDNHLFVSKYLLELPKQAEMQRFLEAKLREVGDAL